jgi:hypothetical protein
MTVVLRKDQLQLPVTLLDGSVAKFLIEVKRTPNGLEEISEDLDVRKAFRRAIGNNLDGDTKLSWEKKLERFMLSEKIWKADEEVRLLPSEIQIIKECIAQSFNIETIGFLCTLLEQAHKE